MKGTQHLYLDRNGVLHTGVGFDLEIVLMFKNAQAVENARKKGLQTDVKKLYYPQQAL